MYQVKEKYLDVHVFVGGETKYLKNCTQKEIETLIKNGKKDYFTKKTDTIEGGIEIEEQTATVVEGSDADSQVIDTQEPAAPTTRAKKK